MNLPKRFIAFFGLFVIGLVAGCANNGAATRASFVNEVEACRPQPIDACLQLLDEKKISGRSRSEVLMSLALSHLTQSDAEGAVPYLDAIVELDPTYALAFQNRGNAHGMIALNAQRNNFTAKAVGSYMLAAINYEKAVSLDPEVEASYTGAAIMHAQVKNCAAAKLIQGKHQAKFGVTSEQQKIADIVRSRCQ